MPGYGRSFCCKPSRRLTSNVQTICSVASKHRFCDDYFPCGTHVLRSACRECGVNLNGWRPPLLYWWEFEFGSPQASLDAGHNCFWATFRFMVDEAGKSLLDSLAIPFSFHATKMTEGKKLNGEESLKLKCVTIDCSVKADPIESKISLCPTCGKFAERRRQLPVCEFLHRTSQSSASSLLNRTGIWSNFRN